MQAAPSAPPAEENPYRAPEAAGPMEAVVRAEAQALREDHHLPETAVRTVAELLLEGGVVSIGAMVMDYAGLHDILPYHPLPSTVDVVLCVLLFVAGAGLWWRQPWARVFASVVAVAHSICYPPLALLGIAVLAALWVGKARRVFTEEYREAILLTPQLKVPGRSLRLIAAAFGLLILLLIAALIFLPGGMQR